MTMLSQKTSHAQTKKRAEENPLRQKMIPRTMYVVAKDMISIENKGVSMATLLSSVKNMLTNAMVVSVLKVNNIFF